ncbi:MAG TPA: PLP-dependent aminotransferase family protein [Pyrinomonadaceae bacterium]|nr:PLP-dependent aminotransferase family protein [Pyrinomonadaceae bacterium]
MTMWNPNLESFSGPRYLAIVSAIADAVERGHLKAGDKMPTHRDLADAVGVTTGTITRAYSEAAKRGLLVGETGRGTFVKANIFEDAFPAVSFSEDEELIDLSLNIPPLAVGDLLGQVLTDTLARLAERPGLSALLGYQPAPGLKRHRAAGADWIARSGLSIDPEQVLVCTGALHAMTVVLSTITNPGDSVFTESLTYPGMKNLAHLLHLRLKGLPTDNQGIIPEAFDKACRRESTKILYTIPTIQNPLGSVMPEERRRAIAEIAVRHGVAIVEDDVHSFMLPSPPPPLSSFAPENSYYILSTSKSIAGGMRIGYLVAPERMIEPLATSLRATVWMAAPLMAEIASEWIRDGTAERLVEQKRSEAAARQSIARAALDGFQFDAHPLSFHLWLHLPEPWRSNEFSAQLRRRGVVVTPAEAFVPGREEPPHAVRVCVGAPRSRAQLEKGLCIIRSVLQQTPDPSLSIL